MLTPNEKIDLARRVTATMITMLREIRKRNGGDNPRRTMIGILQSQGAQEVAFRVRLDIAEDLLTGEEYTDLVQYAGQFI